MPEIVILGRVDFEPGHRERWLAHVDELVEATRQEPGCRRYDVIADPRSSTGVMAIEIYESAEAFRAHGASAHLAHFLTQTSGCTMCGGDVEMFEASKIPNPF